MADNAESRTTQPHAIFECFITVGLLKLSAGLTDLDPLLPLNLSTPALSVGGSIFMSASTFDGSGLRPVLLTTWPMNGNFVKTKAVLLFFQGDSSFATALEEEANSFITFFIGATPDDYIITYTADAF